MSGRRIESGSAMVAVLWLVAVLSLALVAAVRVVAFDIDVASARVHGARARHLAEMGIAVGANPVVERSDPLLRQFDELAGEGFEVRLVSEGAKFNINAILMRDDKPLMQAMFIDWGLDLEQAQALADALGDWVDPDDNVALNGAEEEAYLEMGRVNQPFNRPFYHLDEVRLVRGMDLVEAYNPNWREWFTIWSGGLLDLNEADPALIAVAAETSPEEASVIPETVRGPDGLRDTDDDAPFQSAQDALALIGVDASLRPDIAGRMTVNDTTTRIESIGSVQGARRKISLIVRNRTGRPAVLERTEEVVP